MERAPCAGNSLSIDAMNRSIRQTGAFILATVVFLMVAGSLMLYAMTNLSVVTSATTSVTHNSNMALMAAQSGLKYCVARLGSGAACTLNPLIAGVTLSDFPDKIPPPPVINFVPCKIALTTSGTCSGVGAGICTITSTACCPSATDSLRGAKSLKIDVQKTTGGYQMIPASRQVVTPVTCPL